MEEHNTVKEMVMLEKGVKVVVDKSGTYFQYKDGNIMYHDNEYEFPITKTNCSYIIKLLNAKVKTILKDTEHKIVVEIEEETK